MSHQYDILVVKDFSRFSRRNSRGLVELEDLRDAGVRIISIGDNIDFPNDDDWLKIQFQFLINEMPVTDTSKKVKNVIRRRQADGKWICAAPYGYIVNKKQEFEIVPTEADVVRTIFRLYNEEGWGVQEDRQLPHRPGRPHPPHGGAGPEGGRRGGVQPGGETRLGHRDGPGHPGQRLLHRHPAAGEVHPEKDQRKRCTPGRGRADRHREPPPGHYRLPHLRHHPGPAEKRSTSHYRGVKKYDNTYSGFLVCGDCGAPMFSLSRGELKSAYTCGTYHRRGRAGCTSHHIRADKLDELLKAYVRQVMDHAADMLERLNADLAREQEDVAETEQSADRLAEVLSDLQEELKVTKRQRIRDLMKHPDQEDILEQTYDELEGDLQKRIEGIGHQIQLLSDKRNTIIRVNRAAKTAMEVFRDILNKERLERRDLELIIRKIKVYEDRLEIRLQADVDSILRSGTLPEEAEETAAAAMAEIPEGTVNFEPGMGHISPVTIVQEAKQHPDKVFHANVISDGDPLEIYTSREGEVIFKKYSLLGGVEDFAAELCETMSRSTGSVCAVTDRDTVIAVAGGGKRELLGKRITPDLERIMEGRKIYQYTSDGQPLPVTEGCESLLTAVAAPILAEGDLLGLVLFVSGDPAAVTGDTEYKLAQTIAAFLGRHMES